jgi:hypothetical protein
MTCFLAGGGGVDLNLGGSIYYNGATPKGNVALIGSPLVHGFERHGVGGAVEYGPRKSMDIGFTAQKLCVLPSNIHALLLKSYAE